MEAVTFLVYNGIVSVLRPCGSAARRNQKTSLQRVAPFSTRAAATAAAPRYLRVLIGEGETWEEIVGEGEREREAKRGGMPCIEAAALALVIGGSGSYFFCIVSAWRRRAQGRTGIQFDSKTQSNPFDAFRAVHFRSLLFAFSS